MPRTGLRGALRDRGRVPALRPGGRRRSSCGAAAPAGSLLRRAFGSLVRGADGPHLSRSPRGPRCAALRAHSRPTAVPPPSERGQPGQSCCHRAGLRSALRAKTCGDEPGWPGKGAAAAPHACLQRPKCSFSFSTVSARFLLAQMCAGVARSSAPGRRGGGDKDEDLPALCPHCRTPYGPSALHPHAVLQHCARLAWHGVLFCSGNAALWVSNSHPMLPRDGSEITAAERHSWGELSEASTAPATPRPGCC